LDDPITENEIHETEDMIDLSATRGIILLKPQFNTLIVSIPIDRELLKRLLFGRELPEESCFTISWSTSRIPVLYYYYHIEREYEDDSDYDTSPLLVLSEGFHNLHSTLFINS